MKTRKKFDSHFDITSGIKQGCNLSATLFKMTTYQIMNEIKENVSEMKINSMKWN